MGIFDRIRGNKSNGSREETINIDGYEIGVSSGLVYHAPRGLKKYKLPERAKSLSEEACRDMSTSIESLDVPGNFEKFDIRDLPQLAVAVRLKSIHFGEGLRELRLNYPTLLERISYNVPESLTHMGENAYVVSEDGKLVIGHNVSSAEKMFASHDVRIKQVEVYGKLKMIPDGAFNQCKNIESIIIHDGVESSKGKSALRGTNKLKLLELPENFSCNIGMNFEHRTITTVRNGKTYTYNPSSEEMKQEENSILTINIQRKGKKYSFQVRRGDLQDLSVDGNDISFGLERSTIGVELDKLDSRAIHTIANGEISSKLPPEIAQHERVENLRKAIGGTSQNMAENTPRIERIPRTLSTQDLAKYKSVSRRMLKNLAVQYGWKEEYAPEHWEEGLLEEFEDHDEKIKSLSVDEKMMIGIALYAEKAYVKSLSPDENSNSNKRIDATIREFEDLGIIYDHSTMVIMDIDAKGRYLRQFESKCKSIEERNWWKIKIDHIYIIFQYEIANF